MIRRHTFSTFGVILNRTSVENCDIQFMIYMRECERANISQTLPMAKVIGSDILKLKFLRYAYNKGTISGHFIISVVAVVFTHENFIVHPGIKPLENRVNSFLGFNSFNLHISHIIDC